MSRRSGRDPSETELTTGSTRLAIGFVLIVGLSGGSIALQGGASIAGIGLAVLAGLLAGTALWGYLYRMAQ